MHLTPGNRNLLTDVPGFWVGNAQDANVKTGVTVVTGPAAFTASVSVLGGAPGTRETDLLRGASLVDKADALVLSGGSGFGLDACSGVSAAMRAQGRGFPVRDRQIPIVPGAIVYDLSSGGATWETPPWANLGKSAAENVGTEFEIGTVGAGTGALTAGLKGGLGSASVMLEDGTTVGAIAVANAIGEVAPGPDGAFWAGTWELGAEFGGRGPARAPARALRTKGDMLENTTIAVVATDAALGKVECERVAIMAHAGIARAVAPSHSPFDGDLVFAAASAQRTLRDARAVLEIGHAAATCLARAIARGVYAATPAAGDPFPTWSETHMLKGSDT